MNDAAHLGERLCARLHEEAPALPLTPRRSEYDFDPEARPQAAPTLQPAAVMVPIVERAEACVLFTRRSDDLPHHAGQVSFPGGRAQPGDASLVATALREMEEETGIGPAFVSIEGFLDVYETGTGYAILPVVGRVRDGFALKPCSREVAEIFEVPLAFLLDPANRAEETREWLGRTRRFYVFRYRTHYIWGATAAMLVDLAQRLA
jgi:8-oxo-dGTP pyrophosphatase MutT (NUDIX family)